MADRAHLLDLAPSAMESLMQLNHTLKNKVLDVLETYETQTNINSTLVANKLLDSLSTLKSEAQMSYVLSNSADQAMGKTPASVILAQSRMEEVARVVESIRADLRTVDDKAGCEVKKGLLVCAVIDDTYILAKVSKVCHDRVFVTVYDVTYECKADHLEVLTGKNIIKRFQQVTDSANLAAVAQKVSVSMEQTADDAHDVCRYQFNARYHAQLRALTDSAKVNVRGKRKHEPSFVESEYDKEVTNAMAAHDRKVTKAWVEGMCMQNKKTKMPTPNHATKEVMTSVAEPEEMAASSSSAASFFDDQECVVCSDGAKTQAMVPCGHLCCCDACAAKVMAKASACPMCRAAVQTTIKVFM